MIHVFWLFIRTLICIIACFVISKALYLSQFLIVLLSVLVNSGDINTSSRNLKELVLLSPPQMGTLFLRPIWCLAWLANSASITAILTSSIGIRGILYLKVFLILKLSICWLIATGIANITLPGQELSLVIYLCPDVNRLLNSLCPIRNILFWFI